MRLSSGINPFRAASTSAGRIGSVGRDTTGLAERVAGLVGIAGGVGILPVAAGAAASDPALYRLVAAASCAIKASEPKAPLILVIKLPPNYILVINKMPL